MGKTARDNEYTTSWAMASLGGGGFIVGYNAFELVNRETGRGHILHLGSGGVYDPVRCGQCFRPKLHLL
jgi:hypothetical protein